MPTPPVKRGVEGGVSEMRDSVLGADVALEGLDPTQELPQAFFGPKPLFFKDMAWALRRDSPHQT